MLTPAGESTGQQRILRDDLGYRVWRVDHQQLGVRTQTEVRSKREKPGGLKRPCRLLAPAAHQLRHLAGGEGAHRSKPAEGLFLDSIPLVALYVRVRPGFTCTQVLRGARDGRLCGLNRIQ